MTNKNFNTNGFEYVDLDLPSGALWSTKNVGASKATDYGLYFQWGDTKGYSADQVGSGKRKKEFSSDWNFYRWFDGDIITKYLLINSKLELEDDAAHIHMGGDWHIPSPTKIQELIDNTISEWTSFYGVSGMKFASKKDSSKYIFIPAAGYAFNGSVHSDGDVCNVWSYMLTSSYTKTAQFLHCHSVGPLLCSDYRICGFSVRGIIG